MSEKKYITTDNLFWHLNATEKRLKNQDIDDFVNAQLACIEVCLKKIIYNDHINKIKILKKSYFAQSEQIAQYFIMLKYFKNILHSIFYK